MEGGVVVENHQHGHSNFASKSMESSIKIDSISIDLVNANEKNDAEKCQHFSIRGYVSQIRKKDWKMCSPFASDGNNDNHEEETCLLPPLDVPKFRFWRCENCLQEIGANGTTKNYGPLLKSCSNGMKSNSICFHAPILGEAEMMAPDFQQPPKLCILEEGKADAKASADINKANDYHPTSCSEKNEKNDEAEKGCRIVSEENLNKEIHRLTCVASDVNPRLLQKTYHSDDIDFLSKCNGSVDLSKLDRACHEVADPEFAANANDKLKNLAKVCERGKETSLDYQCEELIACRTSGEANNVKEAHDVDKVDSGRHLHLESDEHDYASSESADITIGNRLQDLHHDNSVSLHRKKVRKVRLLTELLCENGDSDTNNIRTEDSPSNADPDAPALVDRLSIPQSQVAVQGNARRCLSHNRKRKIPQDEDCRALETISPNKASKAVRILKRDEESTDAIESSESEEDTFTGLGSQTGVKMHWTKRRMDRSPIIGKNKNKKILMFDECLPLVPPQENVSIEAGNKTGDADNDNAAEGALLKSGNTEFNGREIDFFPLPAQIMERNPSLSNIKGKMPKVHDQQSFINPLNHGMLNEGLMTRKDVEITHTGPVIVPFHSAQDASIEKGLRLSLSSYVDTRGYDRKHIPEVEDRQTPLLTRQGRTSGDEQLLRNAAEFKYVGNFSFTSNSLPGTPFGKAVQNDMSSKRPIYRIPFLNERQNYSSQTEVVGRGSLMQRKEFCSTSSNEKMIGNEEHLTVSRKDIEHRPDKILEQGTSDDIPMEIVEYMAKNQYERRLADAETSNNTRNAQTVDFTRVYGHRELNLFQPEISQKRRPGNKNERNGTIKRDDSVGPAKLKSVDYFSQSDRNQFNMSQLEQTNMPAGYGVMVRCQEMPSSGVQHSASSCSRQNSVQNCKWIGNLSGNRLCDASLQVCGPCNTCQSIPQQSKESNHLWSSTVSNRMPIVYGIPPKCTAPSNNMDVFSHSPAGMRKENIIRDHDLKFLNQNVSYLGKQHRNFNSETLGRACAEYPFACKPNGIELNQKPMASLDLYSNETIPAMHLLSLMDAGLRSNAPHNLDATSKFLKRPATHDHDPKDFSRLDMVAYKATNAMKQPLYDYHSKNQAAEDSQERVCLIPSISAIPTPVGASASASFQNDKNLKNIDFVSRVSQEKEKRKDFDLRSQNKGCRLQKSVSTSVNFGTNCGSIPVHSMQTMFFGPSDSMVFPLQYHALENSTKRKLEAPNATGTVTPHKSSCKTEFCSLNRNPSDFSIPEARNAYMIAGEDLKFGKVIPPANGPGLVKLDGQKRQRKHAAVKEHGRHLIV